MYRQIISQRDRLGQTQAEVHMQQDEAESAAEAGRRLKIRNKRSQTCHIQTTSAVAAAKGEEKTAAIKRQRQRGEENVWHA